MTANLPNEAAPQRDKGRGVPFWLPLAGLMLAFLFALFAGSRICPVLSALIFPPAPPLPPGEITVLMPQESQGVGRDEWLFGSALSPCEVYKYYEDRVGGCFYDLDAQCHIPGWGTRPRDGTSFPVGVCQGTQSIGPNYRVTWTIRIGGGYTEGGVTHFRITREVAN